MKKWTLFRQKRYWERQKRTEGISDYRVEDLEALA